MSASRSPRRAELSIDERRLIDDIGESGKAFGMWPEQPGMVPVDIAARAAERAYRRGVTQGAHFMFWHLRRGMWEPTPDQPAFLGALNQWRSRGNWEGWAAADLPPDWQVPHPPAPRRSGGAR